jgi:xylulose-5-phosphate/fructose-6-phosphate phosphoketolase
MRYCEGRARLMPKHHQWLTDQRARHHAYIVEHGEDLPEVRDWQWVPTS